MGFTLRSGFSTEQPPITSADINTSAECLPQGQDALNLVAQQQAYTGNQMVLDHHPPANNESSAKHAIGQNTSQDNDGFTVVRSKPKRGRALDPSNHEKVYPEYTIEDIRNMGDTLIGEFVNAAIPGTKCSSCKRRGKLVPYKTLISGVTPLKFWRCGGLKKPGGCGKSFAQSKVVGLCMQAGKKYVRELLFPNELSARLSTIEISLAETEKMEVTMDHRSSGNPEKLQKVIYARTPTEKHKSVVAKRVVPSAPIHSQQPQPLITKKPLTGESERAKFSRMYEDALSIINNPESSREAILAAGKVLTFIKPFIFGAPCATNPPSSASARVAEKPRVNSYAEITQRNIPARPAVPRYPPTIQRISKIKDPQEKIEVGFRAITKQKKAPMSRRVIKTGSIENSHLREQVAGAKFLYVKGIVRQPVRNIKKTLDLAGIDTSSIYDISFIGKTVCSILCKAENYVMIADVINNSRSGARVLEDFDPMKPGIFRPELIQAKEHKSPEEFLIRRAAFSAVMTNNMVVATAFQAIIPSEYHQAYFEEIAIIENDRANRPRAKK